MNPLLLLVIPFVLTGTANTVLQKLLMNTENHGTYRYNNDPNNDTCPHGFGKPWYMDVVMHAAMALSLLVHVVVTTYRSCTRKDEDQEALVPKSDSPATPSISTGTLVLTMLGPALCDTIGGGILSIGMLWVDASVWQMARGTVILFVVGIRMVLLRKRPYGFESFGVACVLLGLVLVGLSSYLTNQRYPEADGGGSNVSCGPPSSTPSKSSASIVLGIGLVVVAMFVQALQTVIEEVLLQSYSIDSLIVVGLEGAWGVVICVILCVCAQYSPVKYPGIFEDSGDTAVFLGNSSRALGLSVAFMLSILVFNVTGMKITLVSNATSRNLMDTARTLMIWVVMVVIYYAGDHVDGERLTVFSTIQALGFLSLIFGLFLYNKVFRLPCFAYPSPAAGPALASKSTRVRGMSSLAVIPSHYGGASYAPAAAFVGAGGAGVLGEDAQDWLERRVRALPRDAQELDRLRAQRAQGRLSAFSTPILRPDTTAALFPPRKPRAGGGASPAGPIGQTAAGHVQQVLQSIGAEDA